MLTKIVGRVVSQDGAVIQSGTVLFQTKKSGIYEQSLRAPGTEIRNILDGMIEDIHLTPGVYTVHVLPDGSLDAPWNFRIALDGTLPEVDLFEQAPIDDIGGYDKTSLIAAIAESVNPVLGGYVEDAQDAQTAAKTSETNAGVSATNADTSAGTATTQANRAMSEADRAQALANDIGSVATMRVDTSVGKRVYIGNGSTEELVSADSGWRNIATYIGSQARIETGTPGGSFLRIRKTNHMVHLAFRIRVQGSHSQGSYVTFVEGLPAALSPYPTYGPLGMSAVAGKGVLEIDNAATSSALRAGNRNVTLADGDIIAGQISYTAGIDAWLTALPGNPL